MTAGAGFHIAFVPGVPGGFLARLFGVEARQLQARAKAAVAPAMLGVVAEHARIGFRKACAAAGAGPFDRSEEHTSELQSLMRISYAVFCLTQKKQQKKK